MPLHSIIVNMNYIAFLVICQVAEKLKLGAKTAIDIDKLRDGYRPAAKRGAILFFVLSEMSTINTMYQYSLAAYLEVFELSLRKSLPDSIVQKRLRNIMDTLTHNVYNYGCTGQCSFYCIDVLKKFAISEFGFVILIGLLLPDIYKPIW